MLLLLAKELRALRAVIIFIVCLELVGICAVFWTEFPDRLTLTHQLTHEKGATDTSSSLALTSLVLCAGLLVRERDDGTLSFLDGLPVTRTRIFFGKLLAALLILGAVVAFEIGVAALFHLLSRSSLEVAFPRRLLATMLGIHSVIAFTFVSVALALSFLRRWMFLVLALLVWAFIFARHVRAPHIDLFDPFVLATPALHAGRWIVPWANVGALLGVGILAAAIALVGFHALGDGAWLITRRLSRSILARIALVLGTALIPIAWISLLFWVGKDAASDEDHDWNPAASDPATRTDTAWYIFIHRQSQRTSVKALADRAEEIQGKVATFLQSTPLEITVDTTSNLARHNAGQAYWRKVKMRLDAEDAADNAAVLGHETTHVYLDQLSEFKLTGVFASVRFFHEGLASYLEHRFFRDAAALRAFRRAGVVSHAWQPVSFESLADDDAFRRQRSADLVYPLGEIFCAAIVQLHGDEALPKIARAFARPGAPKDLKHLELWQDTLQSCGYSLEAVLGEFRRQLDALVAEDRAFIDALPRPKATVELTATEIIIRPEPTPTIKSRLVCRTRPTADAPEYELDSPPRQPDGTFHLSRSLYGYGTFWYQLGWRVEDSAQPLLDAWHEAPLGR